MSENHHRGNVRLGTSDGLKDELEAISSHTLGWGSRRAETLLEFTSEKLARQARSIGVEPADAVEAAWSIWTQAAKLGSGDLWAWTRSSVARRLWLRVEAQRGLTSESGARRITYGEDDFTGFAADGLDKLENVPAPSAVSEPVKFKSLALRSAAKMITRLGHSSATADVVIESMLERGSQCSSPQSAADRLRLETELPRHLNIEAEDWRGLVSLIFGTPSGSMGALQAELEGIDPAGVKHIRNVSARLERRIAA